MAVFSTRLQAAAVLLLAASAPTSAQTIMDGGLGSGWHNWAGATLSTNAMNVAMQGAVNLGASKNDGQQAAEPKASTAAASTTYRPTPAVTAQVKRQFVAFVRQQAGPEGAFKLQQVLDQADFKAAWRQSVSADGFKEGDAVDAMASYWMLNWLIANGQTESTAVQAAAVRNQVRGVMASNPAVAKLTEAQRQEMAEALMLNFVMQAEVYGDAIKRQDRALLAKLGDAAVARFRSEMDVDLRQLQLTDGGFVKRG